MLNDRESRLEWIKFGILSLIMLGTILIIWLAAPAIFARVVPAILTPRERQPTSVFLPATGNKGDSGEANAPATEGGEAVVDPAPDELQTNAPDEAPAAGEPPAEAPAGAETNAIDAGPASLPLAIPRTHLIQPGETLTTIADRYGISIDLLLQVNPLPNPHRIQAGTELLIPTPP